MASPRKKAYAYWDQSNDTLRAVEAWNIANAVERIRGLAMRKNKNLVVCGPLSFEYDVDASGVVTPRRSEI